MDSDSNSIHELLELFKHLKSQGGDHKTKQLSSLSFSSKNYDSSNRNPLDSITQLSRHQCYSLTNSSQHRQGSIFDKLYQESKQIEMRKCRLQYETRKSIQDKERSQCTFSPNIMRSRNRIRTQFDSIEKNESFYNKNLEWMERREKSIKKMQVQKNQENVSELTFTPRINKKYKRKQNKENNQASRVQNKKGVTDFLNRQLKAKNMQEYVSQRKKNPYSHIWNVKKGHFSYVK